MTQRTASTRLDLPQPFGPTTPVSPGSISKSVGSTKDLKPIRRSRVSFIRLARPSPMPRRCRKSLNAHAESRNASAREMCRIGAENESSGLQAQHAPPSYPDLRAAGPLRAAPASAEPHPPGQKTLILS